MKSNKFNLTKEQQEFHKELQAIRNYRKSGELFLRKLNILVWISLAFEFICYFLLSLFHYPYAQLFGTIFLMLLLFICIVAFIYNYISYKETTRRLNKLGNKMGLK
jgi:ABC-type transport system involved in cytochrome bd biosynthesis fused ATPase/permease subunit